MLKIHLFGAGQARYYDRPLPGFPGHQASILFSYLLINKKRPHLRDRLATVFWPEYPNEIARKYLRNSLWKLRQVLESAGAQSEDYLYISEDSVMFINTSNYWLDVEQFDNCLQECRQIPAESLTEAQAAHLENSLALYTGDLLENIYGDWCLEERERLRINYLGGMHKLMLYHTSKGHYQRAIQCGRDIISIDKAQERTHRQLMLLFFAQGDRNSAINQYHQLRQHLKEELNLQPMVETQRLFEQMLQSQNLESMSPADMGGLAIPARQVKNTAPSPQRQKEKTNPLNTAITAQQIVQRIQQLQSRMDEISQEVSQLETLLGKMLDQAKPSPLE